VNFEYLKHPFSPAEPKPKPKPKPIEAGGLLKPTGRIKFGVIRRHALETGRNRLIVTGALFVLAFGVIGVRLIELALIDGGGEELRLPRVAANLKIRKVRSDITDRNGVLLATSLPTASLYANPRQILDVKEAVQKLKNIFPNISQSKMETKLASDKSFIWLRRNLTPKVQFSVNALGIPGLNFQDEERRVYPHGRIVSHVLGLTNVDGVGLSGIEGYFDKSIRRSGHSLALSIDIRVQSLLREELLKAMLEFKAIGAAGLVIDVTNGEVQAMVSLPDFNPNQPSTATGIAGFNRATKGVYEMGSTFKLFTAAMALDSGVTQLKDRYDARKPIKIARFEISDYHAKNRWLSVPEIIVYSSNIGAAKMALDVGIPGQKKYLKRFGMLTPARIELPEIGFPLTPDNWRKINTMTISYGHGIAVSPIQLTSGVAALVNGGVLFRSRMTKISRGEQILGSRVLSRDTSKKMRSLMRLVVRHGSGRNADVPGYLVGGKTGTADKPGPRGGYGSRGVISSFVAAFPMDKPRYVILVLLDEPKGTQRTHGQTTGGWVAAPVVAHIVKRMTPLFGIRPSKRIEKLPRPGEVLFISANIKKSSADQ
jgi:cell division protein FtsI (penicillin-binding protein 3)